MEAWLQMFKLKTVDLRNGEKAKVAQGTVYVRKARNREESFTVSLSIWERSAAWCKLPYLKKGSLIICTGSVEPSPFISSNGNSHVLTRFTSGSH